MVGTMVAVSSVPGIMPTIVYKNPPATAATMASKIVVILLFLRFSLIHRALFPCLYAVLRLEVRGILRNERQ